MRHFSCILIFLVGIGLSGSKPARAATIPQEPEKDNREYVLDIVTNDYSRWWREIWDSGDNRFRFRLGSNQVSEWFLEEELKLSAPLMDRLRFRFHHARELRYTTEHIAWDVLELEGRIHEQLYLSLYARPTFDKREGALGVMFQSRDAVDRYFILSIEWPGFMRNFTEHHRETSDSLLHIFTEQPVRFGLDMREKITPNLWLRATGELIPGFDLGEEITETGEQYFKEGVQAKAVDGWVEYVVDPSRGARDQMAFGVEAGYQKREKTKGVVVLAPYDDASAIGSTHAGGDLQSVPQQHFGEDLYEETDDDTVETWHDERAFASPYAWVPVNERVTLRGSLRYEKREIAVRNAAGRDFYTTNEYLVPRAGVLYAMGSKRQYILETGLVFEHRKRTEEEKTGWEPRELIREEDIDDHRLYLAFEYAFGESNVIRLNEGFELDARDRGQFGIHDHGFFQLIVGF